MSFASIISPDLLEVSKIIGVYVLIPMIFIYIQGRKKFEERIDSRMAKNERNISRIMDRLKIKEEAD